MSVGFAGRRIHLVGIGGAGMSALVPLLRRAGAEVDGCDLARSPTVERLRAEGVAVDLGHDPAHLDGHDLVVHTSAVPPQHAELRAARDAGIAVCSRTACLAELMRGHRTLAVAGSHGKTTTTWMIGHLLGEAGADPLVMVGGSVAGLGMSGARAGNGHWFVAEVDESDGGFSHVAPTVAVITNLEAEHLDHYGSFDALVGAFNAWLRELGPADRCIVPAEGLPDGVLDGVLAGIWRCGIERGDVRAVDCELGAEGSRFRLVIDGEDAGPVTVPLPGRHMIANAVGAIAAARAVDPAVDVAALSSCERVGRRFTVHGRPGGVRVVEDYAHHPTEIRATIAAASLGGGRVHVLFQPHRYTRTRDMLGDFATAFAGAHACAMLPTYAAGEDAIPGAGGRDLAEAVAAHREDRALTQFVPASDAGLAFLASHARPGDTCLVLGAGDVGDLAPPLCERLTS